jgi:hypothetical protein
MRNSATLLATLTSAVLMSGTAGGLAFANQLKIQVTDETGKPTWTRLEVRGDGDKLYQPTAGPGVILDKVSLPRPDVLPFYNGSFVVKGETTVEVPAGSYRIVAEHGLEYERIEKVVAVAGTKPASVSVRLRPWIRMRQRGWFSGDLHVHRAPENLVALALTEDLNFSASFTMWNRRTNGPSSIPAALPVVQASPHHIISFMNAEDEREGGAYMLHGLPAPIVWDKGGGWYPSGIRYVRSARALRKPGSPFPWFDSEKPLWTDVPVFMALEPPDSIGLLHNHFNLYGMRAMEAWAPPRDQKEFPGNRGFADYVLGLNYRYLNLGIKVPFSAGSASGVLPNPVGYNRVYVPLDRKEPLTPERFYAAIKEGKGFVTNGPMLFTTMSGAGDRRTLAVEVIAREPIQVIELVANGQVIEKFVPPARARKARHTFKIDAKAHSWVAVRSFVGTPDIIRLAHSNPFHLPGTFDARKDGAYFVAWIDRLIADTKAHPERVANETERKELLALYAQARARYATWGAEAPPHGQAWGAEAPPHGPPAGSR